MAQLRDAKTSQILHEGTPLEVAHIALELGLAEVLFDDVGLGFNPRAVLDAHDRHIGGLTDAAKAERDPGAKRRLEEHVANAKAEREHAKRQVKGASEALKDAREARKRAMQRER